MADRKSGIADEINVIRESNSNDLTADLGVITNADYTITLEENPRSSTGNAPDLQAAIQQAAQIELSLTLEIGRLEAMKLMGSSSGGTVTLEDRLPTFNVKYTVTDSDDVLDFTGVKWGEATLTVQEGEPIELEVTGQAQKVELVDETITTPSPEAPSQFLDAHVEIDNTEVAAADSATITYDRSIQSVRGLTNANASERNLPDEIIEGNKTFTFDTTVQITDKQAWEETFDDTSQPLDLTGQRTRKPFKIVLNDGTDSFELTESQITENTAELSNDSDIRTADLTGNAFGANVTTS